MFRSRSAPRWLWRIFLAGTVLLALLLALPATREALLRAAGRALVAQDPLAPADVIVVSIDADGEGVLAAADLVHAGLATRVALFPDPPDRTDREFLRRGLPYANRATIATMQLRALGVTSVELIPASVNGTTAEGEVLRQWCTAQGAAPRHLRQHCRPLAAHTPHAGAQPAWLRHGGQRALLRLLRVRSGQLVAHAARRAY